MNRHIFGALSLFGPLIGAISAYSFLGTVGPDDLKADCSACRFGMDSRAKSPEVLEFLKVESFLIHLMSGLDPIFRRGTCRYF